jgi:aminoglycoside phosphotransferase (APT) family kinase protein
MDAPEPMHDDELPIDEALVRRLLRSQFPRWADGNLVRIPSTGTVNAIFRLDSSLAVRLPRTPRWHDIDHEVTVLERVGGVVPVAVPRPVAIGEPAGGYPWKWAIFEWIDGNTWRFDAVADQVRAAEQLADVVRALQSVDTSGGPRSSRGGRRAMAALDPGIRAAAGAAADTIDVAMFLRAWDAAREAPGWAGEPVWVHTDLLPANVLLRDGRVHAVIDWAGASVGDPAQDLSAAWTLFDAPARARFRRALPFDEGTWDRARAYALRRIHGVAYYSRTNPDFSSDAVRTITEVLNDQRADARVLP